MKISVGEAEVLDVYFRYTPGFHASGKPGRVATTAVIQTVDKQVLAKAEVANYVKDPFIRVEGRRMALERALEDSNFDRERAKAIWVGLVQRGMKISFVPRKPVKKKPVDLDKIVAEATAALQEEVNKAD